jgi:hypothetical protein
MRESKLFCCWVFLGDQECCAECENRGLVIQTKLAASGHDSGKGPREWQMVNRSRPVKHAYMNKN